MLDGVCFDELVTDWRAYIGPLNWLREARLSAPARFMKPYPKYLDWLRYLSAYLLFTYGVSKLAGWQFSLSPDIAAKPIGALSGFQLTWYYYSYSHTYARILGMTQLVGGALLLSRKTALLGAAAMLPMIANILLINLFFHIAVGALCTSALIFASMLALLWRERREIVNLLWSRQPAEADRSRRFHRTMAALILLIVFAQTIFIVWMRR
jgi:uncharacterized membrane protein YphA (DoxX/SURF4 family)